MLKIFNESDKVVLIDGAADAERAIKEGVTGKLVAINSAWLVLGHSAECLIVTHQPFHMAHGKRLWRYRRGDAKAQIMYTFDPEGGEHDDPRLQVVKQKAGLSPIERATLIVKEMGATDVVAYPFKTPTKTKKDK